MPHHLSPVTRVVRLAQRSVVIALAGLVLSGVAMPLTAAAKSPPPSPPIAHTMDGQGDSPLVP